MNIERRTPEPAAERREGKAEERRGPEAPAEVFDVEAGKRDYVKLRVDHAMADIAYDRVLEESLAAADRLASNPTDLEAKADFWKVQERLDAAEAKRDALGDAMAKTGDELLLAEDGGADALKEALSLSYKELARTPEYLSGKAETYASLGLDRMANAFERSAALQRRAEELRERHAELKVQKEELLGRLRAAAKDGKQEAVIREAGEALKKNTAAMEELIVDLDDLTEEFQRLNEDFE